MEWSDRISTTTYVDMPLSLKHNKKEKAWEEIKIKPESVLTICGLGKKKQRPFLVFVLLIMIAELSTTIAPRSKNVASTSAYLSLSSTPSSLVISREQFAT